MSPAKRKSAKSGRAATVAARGGKARGKARGSALAKAVKVKGKTPAKRGDHSLAAARTGARAGARNGAGVACDLPREQLELLLDRDGGRADVLTHVPACHPCTTSLTVIASQRDAIRHLTAEPSGTAVEYLLERGARAGERKLADLVYELAKACLVVIKDIDRRVNLATRPREQAEIGRDLRGVTSRALNGAHHVAAGRLPTKKPNEPDALVAAGDCIEILEQLEGKSERQQLSRAVWLICGERAGEAESLLTRMLEAGVSPPGQLHANRNLLWSLLRQYKFDRILSLEATVLEAFGGDWECLFNLVVAAARGGNTALFEKHSARLRRVGSGDEETQEFRDSVLRFETSRIAGKLGLPQDKVARLLGIADGQRARETHEVG
jgi:hypothetical protein